MPKSALIIQQDLILLKVLERLLLSHSYSCKAIRKLDDLEMEDQTRDFDLIISDILFDGIAPLDFVPQLKEIIPHKSLLIVTSMGQKKIKQDLVKMSPVSGFLSLPFDFKEVEKMLN